MSVPVSMSIVIGFEQARDKQTSSGFIALLTVLWCPCHLM